MRCLFRVLGTLLCSVAPVLADVEDGDQLRKGTTRAISDGEIKDLLASNLAKSFKAPAPSAFGPADMDFWKKRAQDAHKSAATLVSEGDTAKKYDAIIQIGHYPRTADRTGGEGKYVTEQQVAALVATGIAQRLKTMKTSTNGDKKTERAISFIVIPADKYNRKLNAALFIALHTDASKKPCATSASVGYQATGDAQGMHGIALALAITLGLNAEKFMRDNYTKDLQGYYAFDTVSTSRFKGVLEMSELTCPEQEEKLLTRAGVLADNLATAIQFALR